MERNGWILVLGAAILIAAGVIVWVSDEGGATPSASETELEVDAPAAVSASGPGHGGGVDEGAETETSPLARPPDAGVLAQIPGAPSAAADRERPETRRRDEDDAEHSAGWRLGRARRRIAILEPRIERMRAIVEQLEAEGRPELAERQRAVLDRTVRRMEEVRANERELAATAEADGTLGDVERGYEEETTSSARSVARARRPPAAE